MVRIESFQEGADGVAKAKIPGGSLFRLRVRYLAGALSRLGHGEPEGGWAFSAGVDVPLDAFELAAEAYDAECRAAALLARAEQTRAGLERKLSKRGLSRHACEMALDFLSDGELQSDLRFAESWIRQRVRHRAEGPRTLLAGLVSRGVERCAVKDALSVALSGDERKAVAESALRALRKHERDERLVREKFLSLGWKNTDLRDALDSTDTDS